MLKIEFWEITGWEHAIRGMRNPMNSWDKSDSGWDASVWDDELKQRSIPVEYAYDREYELGPNDQKLMMTLRNAGTDHRKFMRMITVYLDITAPLYWWKEFDTYKIGTVANSCSTMHKIHDKEFTIDDFSHEHLFTTDEDGYEDDCSMSCLNNTIFYLNYYRNKFLETKKKPMKEESKRAGLMKRYWWQMIQLLPSSYNQKRTVMLNYEVLVNIYRSRRNHKLDEWHTLCDWIEKLPYSELITGEIKEK